MCSMYPAHSSSWMNTFLWGSAPLSAQKSQDSASLCSSYPLDSPSSKWETCTLSPAPSPEQKWREGKERREEKERKSTTSPLTCSALNWDPTENGISLTAVSQGQLGQRKHFFKKSFFSQLMEEHPGASSKMKQVSVISPPKRDSLYKGRR